CHGAESPERSHTGGEPSDYQGYEQENNQASANQGDPDHDPEVDATEQPDGVDANLVRLP
ncbi:MAG: hypothetical protein M1830_002924, partial [Pleopsidium flavum]